MKPPKLPLLLLRLIAGRQILEELEGDLYEDFLDNLELKGYRKARNIYIWTALCSLRPYILIHNKENRKLKFIDMITYHFKMAIRNMLKHKTFSAINISGLAIGIASSLAILLFVLDQSIKDDFLPNKDRIYRLESSIERAGKIGHSASHHGYLMPAIADNLPSIEAYVRMNKSNETIVKDNNGSPELIEEDFISTDPDFFKIFGFEAILGNSKEWLKEPDEVIVTESAAKRHFGDTNPIGKIIQFSDEYTKPKRITGVVKDPPGNSSIQFDFIATTEGLFQPDLSFKSMFSMSTPVYILLKPEIDPTYVSSRIAPELKKHTDKKSITESTYKLSSFNELKYNIEVSDKIVKAVDRRVIYMFSIIAIFIIALAIINYINLTSARSIQRAQEVGVRKVSGASRGTLLNQFLMESFLTCIIALPLAILLLELIIPYFEIILEQKLFFNYKTNPLFIGALLGGVALIAFIAGFYPALILSRFKLSHFMKGSFEHSSKGALLRKILVIFQLTFSISLIIGALLVQNQLEFIRKKTLSYSPEHIIVVKGHFGQFSRNYKTIKERMNQVSGVTKVSVASASPGDDFYGSMRTKAIPVSIVNYFVDEDYFDIFNLKVTDGSSFNPKADSLSSHVMINQALAGVLKEENPLYSTAYRFRGRNNSKIIGIVEDFHFESLHSEIRPVVISPASSMTPALSQLIIKVETESFDQVVSDIESIWNEFHPLDIFNYQFLDDKLDRQYSAEYKLSKIFGLFTMLAIFISSLGLFGLSTHIAQVKVKEMSIRKVLGASFHQIIVLLGKQVYLLVAISSLIAIPIAYYSISQWLQDFAYSGGISSWAFVLTLGICIALTSLTTGWHTIRTARTNPAESLRNE